MTGDAPLLTVVVPVYNEEATILELIERVARVDISKEILVVEDSSTDRTRELLQTVTDPQVRLLLTEKNGGRGSAVRWGWREARGKVLIHQDGDLEYDPNDYARIIQPILDGEADVVYGSRFQGKIKGMLFLSRMGNRALTLITNLLYGRSTTDLMTCYKAFRTEILPTLDARENGFELEPEITAKVMRLKLRFREVPIDFDGRDYEEGKKMKAKHFFTVFWCLVKYRFVRLRKAEGA